jgi:hypothetical protein
MARTAVDFGAGVTLDWESIEEHKWDGEGALGPLDTYRSLPYYLVNATPSRHISWSVLRS